MKRMFSVVLSIAMMMSLSVPAFATGDPPEKKRQYEIIETYNSLYEKYNQDDNLAMQELLKLYPSLEVVDETVTYFDENGAEILPTRSSMTDVSLVGDKLVHDSDWNTYVYFGYWEWKKAPDELNLRPYDVVGFYTQDPNEMYALEYFLYCYNANGQVDSYSSATGASTTFIAKGEDSVWGAAFWIDDKYIRSGRMMVPLDYTAGSNKKVMLKYCHSWTSRNITGVGGNIGIDGAGFNISWDVGVEHWPGPVTSAGVRLP